MPDNDYRVSSYTFRARKRQDKNLPQFRGSSSIPKKGDTFSLVREDISPHYLSKTPQSSSNASILKFYSLGGCVSRKPALNGFFGYNGQHFSPLWEEGGVRDRGEKALNFLSDSLRGCSVSSLLIYLIITSVYCFYQRGETLPKLGRMRKLSNRLLDNCLGAIAWCCCLG